MNPITSLVTIVFAVIGALLFVSGLQLPGIGFGILAVFVLFSLKMANNWERFVILRAGKLSSVKGPGLFMIIPVVDAIAAVIDERIQTTQFNAEQALTRDTVPVNVDAVIFCTCTTRKARRSISPTTARPSTGWRRRACAK